MSITTHSAKLLQTLTGHTSDVTTCDFAPNFSLITGSSDKTVRIWEWIVGTRYVEKSSSPLRGHKYGVTCVKVSPQGSMLATSSIDGTAVLWNLHSTTKIYTMTQVNGDAIRVCRFAPDSSVLVTAGDNGAICLWDLVHRNLVRTIFQHEGTTQGLAFTPDSQYLVSACSLEYIHIWSVHDLVDTTRDDRCQPLFSADNAHDLGILSLDISNNIKVDEGDPFTKHYTMASGGNSDEIKIWTITATVVPKHRNSAGYVSLAQSGSLLRHSSAITCVKYTSSGLNLVSSSLDKLVKIWDLNGACLFTLKGHMRYVNCVAFSRDFTILATGSNDKAVIVWDLTNKLGPDSELLRAHSQLAILFNDGVAEEDVMNAEQNSVDLIEKIEDIFEGAINSCCSRGNSMVATGSSDKLVRLFNVTDENTLEEVTNSPIDGHSYSVNHVQFNKAGTMLASCSMDGCVIIWDPETGDQLHFVSENRLGIRECRFSPDGKMLATAGDDELATVWDVDTMEELSTLEGHSDAISSLCFTPDGKIIVTASHNSDFRLWTHNRCIYTQDDAHDSGINTCDFSDNMEPIPIVDLIDSQDYLLATGGNDSLVKLWTIIVAKNDVGLDYSCVHVKIWKILQGHGGSVFCVRFSPGAGELVCSTATDRQARVWSVYSAACLHVLDHDSIVTSCAFSQNCSILVIGCIDKTLWIWKLPQQLVFQTVVANKLKSRVKVLADWCVKDVVKWLKDVELSYIEENVRNSGLNGEKIIRMSEEEVCSGLDIDKENAEKLTTELRWLKQDEQHFNSNRWNKANDIPEEYICPITHEIMREPVTVSDGFTYEKRAITEWFMSGKFTSPMTNIILENTDYTHNQELRNAIHNFLYNEEVE